MRARLRLIAVLVSFGSLALAGCKQDIGGRCEQNSDCASGVCGDGQGGVTSAMGRQCVAAIAAPPIVSPDASAEAPEGGDAAEVGDGGDGGEAGDVAADLASGETAEAGPPDGAEAGAEAGGAEVEPDGGADAETGD
jgi:hypothetical protein